MGSSCALTRPVTDQELSLHIRLYHTSSYSSYPPSYRREILSVIISEVTVHETNTVYVDAELEKVRSQTARLKTAATPVRQGEIEDVKKIRLPKGKRLRKFIQKVLRKE